ncbi:MAG: hypothetical protein CMQ24_20545 [Gammaproteobacteria bacterium]|nr:hypothetical protein [Gammaproteobacteria bacterium]
MKKTITALLLIACAVSVQAAPRSKQAAAEQLYATALCQAATESRDQLYRQAREYRISRAKLGKLVCNDIPIKNVLRETELNQSKPIASAH